MTPLQIDIALWYYTRAVDYREGDFSAPAVREIIDHFRDRIGLLEKVPDGERFSGDHRTYRLTERGQAYVTALQALPLPVCHWIVPSPVSSLGPGEHIVAQATRAAQVPGEGSREENQHV